MSSQLLGLLSTGVQWQWAVLHNPATGNLEPGRPSGRPDRDGPSVTVPVIGWRSRLFEPSHPPLNQVSSGQLRYCEPICAKQLNAGHSDPLYRIGAPKHPPHPKPILMAAVRADDGQSSAIKTYTDEGGAFKGHALDHED
jgi:hypothetical protein